MKELTKRELISINGGDVPTAFYMDDDVIKANGEIMKTWGEIVWNTAKPFFKEIIRWAFLGA